MATLHSTLATLARQSCSVASVPTLLLSAASSEHRAEADRERLLTDACITETETLATHTSPHHSLAPQMSRSTAILWRVSVASFPLKLVSWRGPHGRPVLLVMAEEGREDFQHECCWKCQSSWSSVVQAPAAAVGGVVPAAGDRTPTQQQQQQQQQQRLLPYCATTSTTPAAARLHWLSVAIVAQHIA